MRNWTNEPAAPPAAAAEQHYTVGEVGKLWGLSECTVRKIFENMDGVLKISYPRLLKKQAKRKPRVLLRIPLTVLERAHQQQSRRLEANCWPPPRLRVPADRG